VVDFAPGIPTDDGGRCGVLATPHGTVHTPAFMPVGTYGAVKGLTPAQLEAAGVEIVLANAYHLALRPGVETIKKLGGIHRFMGWDGPILTDSGGFQLFSLASRVKVDEEGANFQSHIDGRTVRLTPEEVVCAEQGLGVDIAMAFDVLTGSPGDREAAAVANERTLRWARRTRDACRGGTTAFFGIMQGGLFEDLRRESAASLAEMGFDGYAVGGLSVGEARDVTMATAALSVRLLPADRPRYMMGMGTPQDLVELAGLGYDLFDCVMPTRNGRNGTLFTAEGPLSIRNSHHGIDAGPVEDACDCYTCAHFSRGTLHHLTKRREMLAATLCSIHNVRHYQRLMADIRTALAADAYGEFQRRFSTRYKGVDG